MGRNGITPVILDLEEAGFNFSSLIIGRTPNLSNKIRGEEIKEWLLVNKDKGITSYCILDDDADILEDQLSYFVRTNRDTGLAEQDLIKIKSILG